MRFSFTDDQRDFAAALREMLARECTLAHVRSCWDGGTGTSPQLWSRLEEMGVLSAMRPEPDGGLGLGLIDSVLLFEELGRACVPGPVIEHIVAGTAVAHATGVLTTAERSAQPTSAPIVAHSPVADAVLFDQGLLTEFECIRVAALDGGRSLGRPTGGSLELTGHEPDRLHDALAIAAAAYLVGLSERMLAITADYARQREQFGKPIGSFQAVKHLMADALIQVEFAKAPVYRAAWSWQTEQGSAARDASMAKALANDAAYKTTRSTMQVHGGIGYTWEADLQLLMKKAWALSRAHGDTTYHRRRVTAVVLG